MLTILVQVMSFAESFYHQKTDEEGEMTGKLMKVVLADTSSRIQLAAFNMDGTAVKSKLKVNKVHIFLFSVFSSSLLSLVKLVH